MSLKKSVLLALLVVLICVPALWYTAIVPYQTAQNFFHQAPDYLDTIINETYPHDLEVTVTNGVVSINRPTPYCLVLDKQSQKGVLFDPAFTVDMYKPAVLSAYPLCTPLFVVGDTTILYPTNSDPGYQISLIAPSINMIINKEYIDTTTDGALPVLLQWGWIMYLAAPVLLIPIVFIIVLIVNIWYAGINKIIFSLMDNEEYTPFLKSYALSLRFFSVLFVFCSVIMAYNFYTSGNIVLSFPFFNTVAIAILSIIWAKTHANTFTFDPNTNNDSKPIVESHAIPTPESKIETPSLSDASSNSSYTFDPTVISQPEKTDQTNKS